MKIHIFYRHYNVEGSDFRNRPEWFDFEKCFFNLLDTIQGKEVDLHVIMDGDYSANFIRKYADRYILHPISAGSDKLSFFSTWQIARNTLIDDGDLLYFLENDYLHTHDWVQRVQNLFLSCGGLQYVSLYDHGDKYFHPMYRNLMSRIFVSVDHHWRTTPSTCGSFIIPKKIFEEDFVEHTTIEGDHNKFLFLNSSKGRFVVTPMPGLSTHCLNTVMSPNVDWFEINNLCHVDS